MQLAWYRKYRPQTFTEVVGQEHIKTTLRNQIKAGSFGHAYLFSGPKGTGKTSMARILARSVNCLVSVGGEPCGKCAMCQAFDNGQMLDLIEIDAASNTGVENIRDLIDKIALAPSLAKFKVYVIDEAHQLSKSAFNALLKTLEEPPAHAIFILATTEPHKFPATIISRCQRFDFRHLNMADIVVWLKTVANKETIQLDEAAAELIAGESGGSMRDALSLLEQASSMSPNITKDQLVSWLGFVDWNSVYQLMEMVLAGKSQEAVSRVNQIYQDGYDLNRLAVAWIALVRQILAVKLGNQSMLGISADQIQQLDKFTDRLSLDQIAWLMEELMLTAKEIKTAVVMQLPLELFIVQAVRRIASATVKDQNNDILPPVEPTSVSDNSTKTPIETTAEDWPEVVRMVRQTHPTLSAVLGRTQAVMVGNKLRLVCSSSFHKDTIEQAANQQVIRGALERLGKTCTMECIVDAKSANPGSVAVEEVLQVFGQV